MNKWNMARAALSFLFILLIVTEWSLDARGGQTPDDSAYAALLRRHVAQGVVDYGGFKRDEAKLDDFLDAMAQVDPARLPPGEQKAFYINLYNAWTIKLILTRYPDISSIKDIGGLFQSPWKKKFVNINGTRVSLDYIEHEILRPRFKDPRIHFAVNCASKSCPPLLDTPYKGNIIDAQLDSVTRAFINDPERNHFDGKTLYLSRIFKWYQQDFAPSVLAFIEAHAQNDLKRRLETAKAGIRIEYLPYDWSLNGR